VHAAARVVDRLYAAYFAGRPDENDAAMNDDLRTVRAWANSRARRGRNAL
jgi:hypothetical protein